MQSEYKEISYETNNGTSTITIDRPQVSNAFTEQTIEELNDAINRFRQDDGVYVAIITGANEGFCAGADVTTMPDWSEQDEDAYAEFLGGVQDVVAGLRNSAKPTIAAVAGPAIGAGCDFALACDLRTVDSNALLREGFVNVGLVPGDGGAWLLPRLIGESKAREYLLTGRDITPEDAVDLGLAPEIADDSLEAAHEIAGELLNLPALAVRHTNRLINSDVTFEEHCERATAFQWECVNDPEHKEAVAAFREKRSTEFNREYR